MALPQNDTRHAKRMAMCSRKRSLSALLTGFLASAVLTACGPTNASDVMDGEKGGQELYGHFEPVEGWPEWF